MNPLISKELVELRLQELRREADSARRVTAGAPWRHPWRHGLGQQLEHWGRRLQGYAAADRRLPGSTPV